jgi:hypothetical protein
MRDFLGRYRPRSAGVLALAGAMALVLIASGAALGGNGGDKARPGQAKATGKPTHAVKPVHPAHPAKPVHPVKPVKSTSSGKSAEAQHHVIVCHRTGSATNPYVVINVSIRAWQHGLQTQPALDGRSNILLQDPATPGEKLPVSRCPAGTSAAPRADTVIDATKPGVSSAPGTATVGVPLVIVIHTTPNAVVSVHGAGTANASGTLGATKTTSGKQGVARLRVVPAKQGILSVKVGNRVVKRFGVLGASTSGASLTG